jgi:hypothetical protein
MGEPFQGGEGKDELGITLTGRHAAKDYDDAPVGMVTQTQMLFNREVVNLKRDTASLAARFGLTIFLSILIGVIFLHVGQTNPNDPNVRMEGNDTLAGLGVCFSPQCSP